MKEIIYTAIFAALALLVIVLLIFMFGTGKKDSAVNQLFIHETNFCFCRMNIHVNSIVRYLQIKHAGRKFP